MVADKLIDAKSTEEDLKPKSINEEVKYIADKFRDWEKAPKKKQKEFKLPFFTQMKAKGLAKKGGVLIFLLKGNNNIEVKDGVIQDGFIKIDDTHIHQCTPDFIYLYKGRIPAIVLPEWSLVPIGTQTYFKAIEGKTVAYGQSIIIRAFQQALLEQKKKFGSLLLIIGGILVVGVVGYIIMANKKGGG